MKNPITVLWVGGGQDSIAILYKIAHDSAFKQRYVGNSELVAIMSDTGDEYPETYDYLNRVLIPFCKAADIEFHFITKELGFHGKNWQSLEAQMLANDNIFSVALPKSCTDNLKIKVCYNFLEDYIKKKYGYVGERKRAFYEYYFNFGKMNVIIGFAKGEESRMAVPKQYELFPSFVKDKRAVYIQKNINVLYPLIDLGMNRAACQNFIKSINQEVPMPSNCMLCPFQNEAEIVYLHRFYPDKFDFWIQREEAKLEKNTGSKKRNLGVKGDISLLDFLDKALTKYGHWTNEMLYNYKFSHGHCVKSKY